MLRSELATGEQVEVGEAVGIIVLSQLRAEQLTMRIPHGRGSR